MVYEKTNPYQVYKQQSIMTMTQCEMLVKLYDETIKRLNLAIICLEGKDYVGANEALQKAHQIVNYLLVNLNSAYDISKDLAALYEYFLYEILNANLKKDAEKLPEIITMISELKETYLQADKSIRKH